jgi:hypothetical protein
MKKMREFEIEKIMVIMAKHDLIDLIYWNTNLNFFANCNDVFFWGASDGEVIESNEDLELLIKCCEDYEDNAIDLYCARKRKLRPQNVLYKHYDKDKWYLFDECGEEREVGIGNPYPREKSK